MSHVKAALIAIIFLSVTAGALASVVFPAARSMDERAAAQRQSVENRLTALEKAMEDLK